MRKVLGVIVEYNPFHNGHLYHLEKSKEVTGCQYVVGVMSGNYVQRGEPAIVNKWARTEIALKNGVDLVIELPTVYATQSAEGFAKGTVNLLANTGIVTDLAFGSEIGETDKLVDVARQLLEIENENGSIKEKLKEGISYSDALRELIEDNEVLKGSNNILAVEYLKEILRKDLPIKISTIKRFNNNYNDLTLPQCDSPIASATALRPQIKSGSDRYLNYLPEKAHNILLSTLKIQRPAELDSMSSFFFNLLLRDGLSSLREIGRVENGLENRILQKAYESNSIGELLELAKSKRFPKSRISRLILHFILNIKKDMLLESNDAPGGYIRILGCNPKGLTLLKSLKSNCDVPFSMNYSKLLKEFKTTDLQKRQLDLENSATNIYTSFYYHKKQYQLEYTQNPIILKK